MAAGRSNQQIKPASRTNEVFRLDLVQEVVSINEETGVVLLHMTPDPRRYSEFEEDGESWFLDKYFNTAFRLKDIAEGAMDGLPIYASGRTVSSATEYASERRAAVEHELETGEYTLPQQGARPHAPLTASEERDIAFISVDVCGSTSYCQRDAKGFDMAFGILLRELGSTVARLGAAQRFNHIVAVGASANRTSKMLQHAGANEILIGDAILDGLPMNWRQGHVVPKVHDTGWQYADGTPYVFWLFDGRWPVPQR